MKNNKLLIFKFASCFSHGQTKSFHVRVTVAFSTCITVFPMKRLLCVHKAESFSGIQVFHNQVTVKWVSVPKKFFCLSENCVLACGDIK